jgi:hypothetical protein
VKRRLPYLLLALYASFIPLSLLVHGPGGGHGEPFILIVASGFPLVGAMIAAKRPDNAMQPTHVSLWLRSP